MTFAFSRDDVASFLPAYLNKKVLDVDPFKSLDQDGVGGLIDYAINQARHVKPDLKLGICGEHGGDAASIDFCYRAGLNYVSCSPYRVPLARLAGAQAVLNNSGKTKTGKAGKGRKAGRPKADKSVSPAVKPAARAGVKTARTARAVKPAAKAGSKGRGRPRKVK
jgi:pyruvate,orthophosphate dikinase